MRSNLPTVWMFAVLAASAHAPRMATAQFVNPDARTRLAHRNATNAYGGISSSAPGLNESYRTRLRPWISAWQDWLRDTVALSPEQQRELHQLVEEAYATELRYRFELGEAQQFDQFLPYCLFPVNFTAADGPAERFRAKVQLQASARVLTFAQRDLLALAVADRQQRHRAILIEYLLGKLWVDLHITDAQRDAIRRRLEEFPDADLHLRYTTTSCFATHMRVPLTALLEKLPESFTEAQRLRAQDLSQLDARYVSAPHDIIFNVGAPSLEEQLTQLSFYNSEMARCAAEVRVDYLTEMLLLDDERAARLRTAGKGAVTELHVAFLQTRREQFEFANQAANALVNRPAVAKRALAGVHLGPRVLGGSGIWEAAVSKILTVEFRAAEQKRLDRWKQANIDLAVMLIEQEMWLTQESRAAWLEYSRTAVPRLVDIDLGSQSPTELLLVLVPSVRLTASMLERQSDETQTDAPMWRVLRSYYDATDREKLPILWVE